MFSFIRVTVVAVFLHINKIPTETEDGIRDYGIVVIGLTMPLKKFGLWNFVLEKHLNTLSGA